MSDAPEDFAALLARARHQDQTRWRLLCRATTEQGAPVARGSAGTGTARPYLDSVDLVQSVHRSLMLGLRPGQVRHFQSGKADGGTALTLVRRKAARKWRHLKRQQRLNGPPGDSSNLSDLLLSLHSTEADPARTAQFNDAVTHLCDNLDATEQRMMQLHVEGQSTSEIAAELGINPIALRACA